MSFGDINHKNGDTSKAFKSGDTIVKLLHVATLHIEFHIFTIRLKNEA